MITLMLFFLSCVAGLLGSAAGLHVLGRCGRVGRAVCDALAAAPILDVVVFYFVHGTWVAGGIVWWLRTDRSVAEFFAYFGVAIAAQVVGLLLWSWAHEAMHPETRRGPRIVSTLNRRVGWFRNHAAVWWTLGAVPLFTAVRVCEVILYPPLHWLVRLPRYRAAEWVNVSRHKFDGLVGYDLAWCLYCDWMTGVWSLGSEMLRNVESFWCPIRFSSPEKCENCRVDFPDVATAWVAPPPAGNIGAVVRLLESEYPGPTPPGEDGPVNGWHGHPVRLTVKGR